MPGSRSFLSARKRAQMTRSSQRCAVSAEVATDDESDGEDDVDLTPEPDFPCKDALEYLAKVKTKASDLSPWEAVVKGFADSAEKQRSLPSSLTAYERRIVHELAEKLGLIHVSEGDGDNRHIVLKKRAVQKKVPGASCSVDERHKLSGMDLKDSTDTVEVTTMKPSATEAERSPDASTVIDVPTVSSHPKVQETNKTHQQKNKKPAKPPVGDSKDEEEDFDELIANVMKSDRTCSFAKRGFCFKHALPEVHGCGEEACKQARIAWHRSKGGTVAPGYVKPEKRAQVQKALDKRLTQMAESRKRQTKK
ncbi:hypothetical protein HPB50_021629 [Hyalomma asiaticum]|uniref:Uncharacterized protein n=1 Tax=Hyalomma asiaticum TaxID=266040 RepID=A0ACB7T5T7_HYAAI|nr:hypothetical protein HPB50_021629 [Hyalomma asiaticum]